MCQAHSQASRRMSEQMHLLEGRGLTKEFGGLVAVSDVDIRVRQGDLHSIIGPNGAGKTTLFNLLSGNLPPTRGRSCSKGRTSPAVPLHRRVHLGIGPLVPDHEHLPQPDRARKRAAGGAGDGRRQRQVLAAAFRAASSSMIDTRAGRDQPGRAGRQDRHSRRAFCRTATSASWNWRSCWRPTPSCCCSTSQRRAWRPSRCRT